MSTGHKNISIQLFAVAVQLGLRWTRLCRSPTNGSNVRQRDYTKTERNERNTTLTHTPTHNGRLQITRVVLFMLHEFGWACSRIDFSNVNFVETYYFGNFQVWSVRYEIRFYISNDIACIMIKVVNGYRYGKLYDSYADKFDDHQFSVIPIAPTNNHHYIERFT